MAEFTEEDRARLESWRRAAQEHPVSRTAAADGDALAHALAHIDHLEGALREIRDLLTQLDSWEANHGSDDPLPGNLIASALNAIPRAALDPATTEQENPR